MSSRKKRRQEVVLSGIGVSPGVVVGPAFLFAPEAIRVAERRIMAKEVDHEICRMEDALIETRRQIRCIQKDLATHTGPSDASILDAHLMVLDDRAFIEEVVVGIREEHRNAEVMVRDVAEQYAKVLGSVQDDYLRERVADVRDVARRIIRNLCGHTTPSLNEIPVKHIVVAADLVPSETATMRKDKVLGIVTDVGSPTSHTAVMARALEIPAIVGLHDITDTVLAGEEVLIDGNRGVLIIQPSPARLREYGELAETRRGIEQVLAGLKHEPAETTDGRRIVLSANVEEPDEIDAVLEYGAEGVGLFRSEYLCLARNRMVGEEEQAEAYQQVASRLKPAPVVIRTLDIGGDKFLEQGETSHEMNPFLGCRSIRLSLQRPKGFKAQLRAILRASAHGNVKLMYPMISREEEILQANELLEEAKGELDKDGVPFDRDIEVGVMIEIPSAALCAESIAEHADFFSLGTNDLIQYTLAVDRVNERVAYLYEPTHPAVLKLIRHTIEEGHRQGLWVGLCGEMAADPVMTGLLLGLGVDEMSVAPSAVPLVKDLIRKVSYSQAKALADEALTCRSGADVLGLCRHLTGEVAPELLELI